MAGQHYYVRSTHDDMAQWYQCLDFNQEWGNDAAYHKVQVIDIDGLYIQTQKTEAEQKKL